MEYHRPFLKFLQKFIPFTEEEYMEYFHPILVVRNFKKKDIILRAGEQEKYFNLVVKGLARKYYNVGNDECNRLIAYENQILISHQSFILDEPSEFTEEALEPTTLLSMSKPDMDALFHRSQKMERLGRLVVTFMMVVNDKWQWHLIKYPPRERFLLFVEKNPELIRRVPQKQLASYLQIKPETFSRFKHMLKTPKKAIH